MNNMTPEQIQAILAAGGEDPQRDGLQRQQQMIDALRQRGMAGTQQQMVGGRVIPNWMGAVSNLAGSYAAQKMQPNVDQGMKEVAQRGTNARQQYLQAMTASMRRGQPEQGQQMAPMQPSPPEPGAY